jgi:hypothetical protein
VGAIADLSDLIARLSGGSSGSPERIFSFIDGRVGANAATVPGTNRWYSYWLMNGSYGGAGSVPTTAAAPTRATPGALGQTNAAGGMQKWLVGVDGVSSAQGLYLLYDRLLHCGGLSGTSTSPQTVGGTLTRNTGGEGNQIWAEVYTAVGSTAVTISASYTNQAGVSSRTTVANFTTFGSTVNALNAAQRIVQLPLQDGDTGVQAVASVTLGASTGTVGNFGITVARPLFSMMCPHNNIPFSRDLLGLPPFVEIEDDACLALAAFHTGTTQPTVQMFLTFVDA